MANANPPSTDVVDFETILDLLDSGFFDRNEEIINEINSMESEVV